MGRLVLPYNLQNHFQHWSVLSMKTRLWRFLYKLPNGEVITTEWIYKEEGEKLRELITREGGKVFEVQNKYVKSF